MNFKLAARSQQIIALRKPCEFAEQCYNPVYFFDLWPQQELFARVGMTVNVGEE